MGLKHVTSETAELCTEAIRSRLCPVTSEPCAAGAAVPRQQRHNVSHHFLCTALWDMLHYHSDNWYHIDLVEATEGRQSGND